MRLDVSAIPVQLWHPRRCLDCSVHEAGCLSSPSAVLGSERMPGELLIFSPHWNPKEMALMQVKKCLSSSIDELASQSEDKQATSKNFPLPWSLTSAAMRKCGLDLGWASPLKIIRSRKSHAGAPSSLGVSDYRDSPVGSQDRPSHRASHSSSQHCFHHLPFVCTYIYVCGCTCPCVHRHVLTRG